MIKTEKRHLFADTLDSFIQDLFIMETTLNAVKIPAPELTVARCRLIAYATQVKNLTKGEENEG